MEQKKELTAQPEIQDKKLYAFFDHVITKINSGGFDKQILSQYKLEPSESIWDLGITLLVREAELDLKYEKKDIDPAFASLVGLVIISGISLSALVILTTSLYFLLVAMFVIVAFVLPLLFFVFIYERLGISIHKHQILAELKVGNDKESMKLTYKTDFSDREDKFSGYVDLIRIKKALDERIAVLKNRKSLESKSKISKFLESDFTESQDPAKETGSSPIPKRKADSTRLF